MIVAIADIHGKYDSLCRLMEKLDKRDDIDFDRDTFVFLGDYVDGHPDVKRVIESLRDNQQQFPHWVFLKGNHEQMMLDALLRPDPPSGVYELWFYQGGMETAHSWMPSDLTSYEKALWSPRLGIPMDVLEWCDGLKYWHETESFWFVHAGIVPGKSPSECHPDELLWIRDQFIDSTYHWPKRVIYGHTYAAEPRIRQRTIGIDTMYRGGGKLTAVLLDDDRPDWHEFIFA